MDGEIASAGDIATGMLVAGQVEPGHGQRHDAPGVGTRCLNCGTPLTGAYCHRCGQRSDVHRTVGAFWHDLLHGVLHFEGKIWRTLPMLAMQPGDLTRRYVDGERAQFVSPLALFLFVVFLTFATLNMVGLGVGVRPMNNTEISTALTEMDADIARLQQHVDHSSGNDRADAEAQLDAAKKTRAAAAIAAGEQGKAGDAAISAAIDNPTLERMVHNIRHDPHLLLYKLQNNAYKYAWALIPLSAPFIWLLFAWRRQYGLYDHLVFVTYSIAFMLALFVTLRLLTVAGVPSALTATVGVLWPPMHIYRQLRGAYRASVPGALVRTALITIYAVGLLALFVFALFAWGAMG